MIEVELTSSSPKVITSLNMKVQEMKFNESVNFRVELINVKNLVDIQFVEVTGDNYNRWHIDDDYIIDFVVSQLGYKRKGEIKIYRDPISEDDYLELEDELAYVKNESEEFKAKYEEEVIKLKTTKKNMEEVIVQSNMLTEKLGMISFEKNSLKLQLENINSKYEELNRTSDDKKRNYEYLINRINELNLLNNELNIKLEEKNRENDALQSCVIDLSDKKSEYENIKNVHIELETNYNRLKEESKRIEMLKSQFQNRIIDLENELENSSSYIDNLESDFETTKNNLFSIQKQVQSYIANEEKLNNIVNMLECSKMKNEEMILSLNNNLNELKNTVSNQVDYIEQLE